MVLVSLSPTDSLASLLPELADPRQVSDGVHLSVESSGNSSSQDTKLKMFNPDQRTEI